MESFITKHVFNRIKIQIFDTENDEYYQLDIPPHIYEELKRLIKKLETENEDV